VADQASEIMGRKENERMRKREIEKMGGGDYGKQCKPR